MTTLPFFQVDAFADKPLAGNPAAVMPLERWLADQVMQALQLGIACRSSQELLPLILRPFPVHQLVHRFARRPPRAP